MGLGNFLHIFSLIEALRTRKVSEGKQFFQKNYSGLSWHFRERRYLLMTKKGPVEYVFTFKHYFMCISVFIFGLISSLTIFTGFIINVLKDDLVSSARATPIVVADFIDHRALISTSSNFQYKLASLVNKRFLEKNKITNSQFFEKNLQANKLYKDRILEGRNGIIKNIDKNETNIVFGEPIKEISLDLTNFNKNKLRPIQELNNLLFIHKPIQPQISVTSLKKKIFERVNLDVDDLGWNNKENKANLSQSRLLNIISWFKPSKETNFNQEGLSSKNKIKRNGDKKINNDLEFVSILSNPELFSQNTKKFVPEKMPPEAEAYRVLSSFDNEILQFRDLINTLEIKLDNELSTKIDLVLEKRDLVAPDSPVFFEQLTNRISITKDLRYALNFIPLKAPMDYYYVSSKYGMRKDPKTKQKRFHRGIDLAGTWHEDVLAPADGVVIFAGINGGYGKFVKIRHKYGIVTAYGHLQKIHVSKGQKLGIRDRIGKMGNTGRSTGQHLHYEIIINGKHINPAIYLREGKKLLTRNILQVSSD
mgnify:CR=1 FL=1